jgi:hypothetical protein
MMMKCAYYAFMHTHDDNDDDVTCFGGHNASSHVQFAVRMSVVQYFAVVLPKIDYANFCSLK